MTGHTIYTAMWPRVGGWWFEEHTNEIFMLHFLPMGAYVFKTNTITEEQLELWSEEDE